MKKLVTVITTQEIEIDIPDDRLTPEFEAEFERGFFDIDGPDDLFTYAAGQVARHGAHFIEGLGDAKHYWFEEPETGTAPIKFKELSFETEFEIEEPKA